MKTQLIIISWLFFLFSCQNNADTKKNESDKIDSAVTTTIDSSGNKDVLYYKVDLIEVGESGWGAISELSTFDDLVASYGEENVINERICGPECADSIDITRVYPNTNKELIVHWKEKQYHKVVSMVECYAEKAPYHTVTGLGIGTTLKELLSQNGKKITFYGFGWDYGGYVSSFNGGSLDNTRLGFRLNLDEQAWDKSLMGDMEINTDMPAVIKKLENIKIDKLTLSFSKGTEL
jgi:hypothetical protein